MDRSNIEKIAQTEEDKILLARLWDKVNAGIRKNIPVSTCFLSSREQEMAKYLFGKLSGLYAFGGYGCGFGNGNFPAFGCCVCRYIYGKGFPCYKAQH